MLSVYHKKNTKHSNLVVFWLEKSRDLRWHLYFLTRLRQYLRKQSLKICIRIITNCSLNSWLVWFTSEMKFLHQQWGIILTIQITLITNGLKFWYFDETTFEALPSTTSKVTKRINLKARLASIRTHFMKITLKLSHWAEEVIFIIPSSN